MFYYTLERENYVTVIPKLSIATPLQLLSLYNNDQGNMFSVYVYVVNSYSIKTYALLYF